MAFTQYFTNNGLTLLNEAVSGAGAVIYDSIKVGSGYPSGSDNPLNFTGLKNAIQTLGEIETGSVDSGITSINDSVLYQTTIRFQVSTADAPSTYQFNEYGIFAHVGSDLSIMICYMTTGGAIGDTITPSGSGTPFVKQRACIIPYSQSTSSTTSLTLTPEIELHASTHLDNGTDPIPVATTSRTGSLTKLSGNTNDVLHGDGTWSAGFFSGMLMDYAGSSAPTGWLLCDGTAYSRSTYSTLFGIIGTTYGAGDGLTTFNVPDFRGRVVVGAGQGTSLTNRVSGATGGEELHVLVTGELAAHNHTVIDNGHNHGITQSAHTHTQAAHNHVVNIVDAGHSHGVYDPEHSHQYIYGNLTTSGLGNELNAPYPYNNFSGQTGSSPTNISIYAAATGITASSNNTTATNNSTSITISNLANTTGITTANQGSSTGHNTMMPFLVALKIIKV